MTKIDDAQQAETAAARAAAGKDLAYIFEIITAFIAIHVLVFGLPWENHPSTVVTVLTPIVGLAAIGVESLPRVLRILVWAMLTAMALWTPISDVLWAVCLK